MNKYQKVILVVAAVNIGLMCLFPPVLDTPIARHLLPSFDGFRPFFGLGRGQRVHTDLLALQLFFVGANALAAWLAVATRQARAEIPPPRYTLGVGAFAAVSLAVMLLFPPFETYPGISRMSVPSFDGFYFILGERSRRAIFAPIQYLEILLVAINALVVWLLFGVLHRQASPTHDELMALARQLPPEEALRLSEDLIHQAAAASVAGPRPAPGERRQSSANLAAYHGSERRHGEDRRRRPR